MRFFSKPKPNLNVTLSKRFYMTVFSTDSVLPPLVDVIHPKRMQHIVVGMGAPLAEGSDPEDLNLPMKRGTYALVTMNRKTVLKMVVVPMDEYNLDINSLAAGLHGYELNEDTLQMLKATWHVSQFSYESFDPQVHASLRFLYRVTDRLAEISHGIIADPLAQRFMHPGQWYQESYDEDPIGPHELVSVVTEEGPAGPFIRTYGLAKLDHLDFMMQLPTPDHSKQATLVLHEAVKSILKGRLGRHGLRSAFEVSPIEEGLDVVEVKHRHPHVHFDQAFAAWKDQGDLYN